MSITVQKLAELVQGQVEGDGDLAIAAARPLHEAQPGHITFLDNPKKLEQLQATLNPFALKRSIEKKLRRVWRASTASRLKTAA